MDNKKVDKKMLLFTLVLILIVLYLLNSFLSNRNRDKIWDYENISSASSIVYQGSVVKDRETYYILEEIIRKYIDSYNEGNNESNSKLDITYEEYYKYLTDNYKNYLGKSKYLETARNFFEKFHFVHTSPDEGRSYMDVEGILKSIYQYDENVYLCELKGKLTGNSGFIAIQLSKSNNAYKIVYIE